MNKFILGIATSCLFVVSALADTTNFGATVSFGKLEADGTNTTNSSGSAYGGAATSSNGDMDIPLASVFAEKEVELSAANIAFGIDLTPLTEEAKLGGGTGFDATVTIENQFTAYIQPSKALNDSMSIFVKFGYSRADIEVDDVSRQATSFGTVSTDAGASKSLEGPMIGVGFEKNDGEKFARIGVTHTDYDQISYTNSNSKVLTADAELTAIHLSFGKKF